jgi:hypothetical protein
LKLVVCIRPEQEDPMYRACAFAALCLLADPALAADQDGRVDAFVTLMTGIGDGAMVNVGHGAVSRVTRTGPGRYEVVVDRSGATMGFAASEPQMCVLQLDVLSSGQPIGGGMRLDLNRVTGIDVRPLEGEIPGHVVVATGADYDGPLNGIAVEIAGSGDVLQASPDGVTSAPMAPHASFITSLSVDDLQSAARTLRAACPGP